jgi:predicted hydrocarbon binding protein
LEQIPKEVLVGRVERGERLAQIVVKMKDVVGAVASVSALIASLKVDIRQSLSYSLKMDSTAIYNAFVVLNDPEVTLEQLVERINQSPFVLEAHAFEGLDGTVVDTISFPVNWQGRRVVILSQPAAARMFDGIRSVLGTGGYVVLYELGIDYGKELAGYFMDKLGRDYLLGNYNYWLNVLAATGWGVPDIKGSKDDFPNLTIGLSSCLECDGRSSREAVCSFMRGFLSGVFGGIAGHVVHCEESLCQAKGDSHCEFQLRSGKSVIGR